MLKMKNKEALTNKEFDSLLSQWQVCVESADSVSGRRDLINGLFATLSVAMVTSATALWGDRAIPLLAVGCIVCIAWLLYTWSIGRFRLIPSQLLDPLVFKFVCAIECI